MMRIFERAHGGHRRPRDRGLVTAEFAVSFPVIAVVLALTLAAVGAATAQLLCVDPARAGARAAARGDGARSAIEAARAAAPSGAEIRLTRRGSEVRVEVRGRAHLLGPLGGPSWTLPVSGLAVAQ